MIGGAFRYNAENVRYHATPWLTGDGSTSSGTLLDRHGNPISSGKLKRVDSIHRTDWQGRQLLYATARTNLTAYSTDFSNAFWIGYFVKPAHLTGGESAPDGSATAFSFPKSDAVGSGAVNRCGLLDNTSAQYTNGIPFTSSIYLRADAPCVVLIGLRTGSAGLYACNVTTSWQRFSFTYTPVLGDVARGFSITFNQSTPAQNVALPSTTKIYCWHPMTESGVVATPDIPTPSSSFVTITDYTLTGPSVALGQVPDVGAGLDWDGVAKR